MSLIKNIPQEKKKRIVIIGGGFAGMALARRLDNRKFQIVLIDRFNFHQFQPLLYQVATAGLTPSAISFPLRKVFHRKKDFHYRMCDALSIIPEEKMVETTIGTLKYDYLVIAAGCTTNFFGNDNLRRATFPLKSTAEALSMRNQILLSLEKAVSAETERDRKKNMTFVVVGGGATGVELAGALSEMRKYAFPKDYPELNFQTMKIYLIEAASKILGTFAENLSENAEKHLRKMEIELRLNTSVTNYKNESLELSSGEKIETATVLWVAGVTGNKIEGLDEKCWERGRIKVNAFNQVDGYNNIFAIGDIALMVNEKNPKGHPQVAQVAIQQACNLAGNLQRILDKKMQRNFIYDDKGSLATIGRNVAIAQFKHFRMKGFPAWILWSFVHLVTIMGMENKINVFIRWIWSYFTNDPALRILIRPLCRDKNPVIKAERDYDNDLNTK